MLAAGVRRAEEFAEAVEEADDAAQAYWLNIGRKGVMLGKFAPVSRGVEMVGVF